MAVPLRPRSHRVRSSPPLGVTWIPLGSAQQNLENDDEVARIDCRFGFETEGANDRAGDANDTHRRGTWRRRRAQRRKDAKERPSGRPSTCRLSHVKKGPRWTPPRHRQREACDREAWKGKSQNPSKAGVQVEREACKMQRWLGAWRCF